MYFDLACFEVAITETSDVLSSLQPFTICFEKYLLNQLNLV
jgi:hypothetical protein